MIDETVRQIEEMDTQSASVVAVKAAEALRELADREYHDVAGFVRALERNSGVLQRANHSHAPLYTTQQRILTEVIEEDIETVAAAKDRLLTAIDTVVDEVESSKSAAAERAADLIDDGDVLLTHENSSTVMETVKMAHDAGKHFDLYVTESRPRFLGRRTARELVGRERIDTTLLVDSAAGHYLSECDRVFIGMNCLIDEKLYNRVGTYPIVATAAEQDVPVTVVASSSKIIGEGFTFENTARPAHEVLLEPADGFEVANPGYDATPTRLVDTVVTEEAIIEF